MEATRYHNVPAVELEIVCPSAAGKKCSPSVIASRHAAQSQPNYVRPNDFLQWMMDTGIGEEQRPEKLAHRQLILILASVDTTTRAGAHAIYDMCARPEYFEPLREEIETVLREDGGWGKPTLTKMRKLDSFLRESQRLSPANIRTSSSALCQLIRVLELTSLIVSFHRIIKSLITLSDGI
jgi:hypothetical protein